MTYLRKHMYILRKCSDFSIKYGVLDIKSNLNKEMALFSHSDPERLANPKSL